MRWVETLFKSEGLGDVCPRGTNIKGAEPPYGMEIKRAKKEGRMGEIVT